METEEGSTAYLDCVQNFEWFFSQQFCTVNLFFVDFPFVAFLIGLGIPFVTWLIQKLVSWLIDSRRQISGNWLLVIFEDNKPTKFDLYKLRQRRYSVTGTIRRLLSLEDQEQTKRRYGFVGYSDGGSLIYSFWPESKVTSSFGSCTLKLSENAEATYSGLYTRPFGVARAIRKGQTASIILTRSPEKVRELIGGLEQTKQEFVWRKTFGLFGREKL
ncbi:hypothetical protein [Amphritea balenae]|uniref:Uncharacterized protein n=1 Tax=Amphritea balenae TaxID=452629 RepID=A0A3P1SM78_9GAMM|nr:hypothetical protein [Amphritea balenae]RRC98246.1 hypothetical protein EHS89_14235 [Amphritea balenae]